MFRFLTLTFLIFLLNSLAHAGNAADKARILFIPLDDRPPCLQFTERMGLIGDANVVSPPVAMLGKFTQAADSEKIIDWLLSQDVESFDAAIISFDMIAFGGLVGSRVHKATYQQALKRLSVVESIRKRAPKLKIYAQSVLMRLAPTADNKNEAYREKLAEWAAVAADTDKESKKKTQQLQDVIPADGLADYKMARLRNHKINRIAIDLVHRGIVDYLLLTQDDAKPKGVHIPEREKLISKVKELNLEDKIAVQPGADEVSMLLLARALNRYHDFSPRVKAVYSSQKLANTIMPFEDRPLHRTVSFHIDATASREVADEKDADVLYYVYASRFEKGRAESFADEIEEKIRQGKRVIVADVDPKGDVQGGDSLFTLALQKRHLLAGLSGYASWNTAGNTIGTALPQGVIFTMSEAKLLNQSERANRIWTAQNWFLLHRVLDDYYFHNLIRAKANRFVRQIGRSSALLSDAVTKQTEDYCLDLLTKSFKELVGNFQNGRADSRQGEIACGNPTGLVFRLPWNRTFESFIDFNISCSLKSASAAGN